MAGVAIAYPLLLLAAYALLRFEGERWWVSLVGLYLPRLLLALPLPVLAVLLHVLRMRRLLWLQAVSAVLVIFPLMGFVVPVPHSVDRTRPTIRVLSYNVDSGRNGMEAVLAEVDRFSPDIVLLQETGGYHQSERFTASLKTRYPMVQESPGFIMATRYTRAAETPTHVAEGPYASAILETPLGRIAVYNVHTISPRQAFNGIRRRRGLLREMREGSRSPLRSNAELRMAQVSSFVAAAAAETDPVLLAGDTNLPVLSPIFARFLSGYEDAFSEAGWGFGYTFPTTKLLPWMRIDRILAGGPLRFVAFQRGNAYASDHFCVVADVQRR
jgi:endonuclease/exonuclease/phosphatase (EEP) superfamily protein YafD